MVTRRRRAHVPPKLEVQGALWVSVDGAELGGAHRMGLLRAVAQEGSITRAAKAYGMSYKGAWQAIDAMNALAGEPLVERSTGGRGGGATRLTARGRRLLERFDQVEAVHQRFIRLLGDTSIDLAEEFSLLKTLNMKTTARNQFLGTVSAIRTGAVNDEIELTLPGGAKIVAIVTSASTAALGLKRGGSAIALVKSSSVLLATGLADAKLSARNRLAGTVASVTPGAVNSEVVVEVGGGVQVVAIVTQGSVGSLGLQPGAPCNALFQASEVILAVTV
jgi:molybdate transport system regulatory protein